MLNGLFDIDNRLEYLTENGDILPNLKKLVPWKIFVENLRLYTPMNAKAMQGADRSMS